MKYLLDTLGSLDPDVELKSVNPTYLEIFLPIQQHWYDHNSAYNHAERAISEYWIDFKERLKKEFPNNPYAVMPVLTMNRTLIVRDTLDSTKDDPRFDAALVLKVSSDDVNQSGIFYLERVAIELIKVCSRHFKINNLAYTYNKQAHKNTVKVYPLSSVSPTP